MSANLEEVVSFFPGEKVQENSNSYKVICPCHNDHKPTLSISIGNNGNAIFHCFACNATLESIAATMPDKQAFMDTVHGHTQTQHASGTAAQYADYTIADYAKAKCLDMAMLHNEFKLFDNRYRNITSIAIPYFDIDGQQFTYRRNGKDMKLFRTRNIYNPKGSKPITLSGAPSKIYGLWKVREWAAQMPNPYVIFTEGESDVHSLWQGRQPALGIPGARTYAKEGIDKALKEQGIDELLEKFTIYLTIEDEPGLKAFYDTFKNSRHKPRIKCIKFRLDVTRKPQEGELKDASDLLISVNGDTSEFNARLQTILENAVSFDEFFGNEDIAAVLARGSDAEPDEENGGNDKRQFTSPKNGELGGRPAKEPPDYIGIAAEFAKDERIQCFRCFGDVYYQWDRKSNKYAVVSDKVFANVVMQLLSEAVENSTAAQFHITSSTKGIRDNICANLAIKKYLALDAIPKECKFLDNPEDETIYLPCENKILKLHDLACYLYDNFPDGLMWDLTEEELRPFVLEPTPNFFSTICSAPFLIKDANGMAIDYPVTKQALEKCFPETPDAMECIFNMGALSLTSDRRSNVFFVLLGDAGTGKSTLGLGALKAVWPTGNYYALSWAGTNEKDSKFEFGRLTEVRLNITDETADAEGDFSEVLRLIKLFTGGGVIVVRTKFEKRTRELPVTALYVIATNYIDFLIKEIRKGDTSITDRLRIVIFDNPIRGTEDDNKNLVNDIQAERSAILLRLIWQLGKIIRNKWNIPQTAAGQRKLDQIKLESATELDKFLKSHYEVSPIMHTSLTDIRSEYGKWIEDRRFLPGMDKIKDRAKTLFKGIEITRNDETMEDFINLTKRQGA